MLRSAVAWLLQAAVMAAMVAGTVAFTTFDRTVTLTVDGQPREVRSFSRTVGDVLAQEGIAVNEHDSVAPSHGSTVEDGERISVRFGRPLDLTLDGEQRTVWVTANTVEEALGQLNVRAEGAYLSTSRSGRIPREGMSLEVRTPKQVTILAEGERKTFTTTALTVGDALKEAGIKLRKRDKVEPAVDAPLRDEMVIRLTRVYDKRVEKDVEIPYKTIRKEDPDLAVGQQRVERRGQVGLKVIEYGLIYTDGEVTTREKISEKVVEKPVDAIVYVGTKPVDFQGAPTGVENLNWGALAECESGGNPDAVNPAGPYYGLYQFSLSTWQSVGGSGLPTAASSEEQTYRAQVLYKRSGAGQWPVCGKYLYS